MGKHLAEELANYYIGYKNQKLFRNGMNLSELAEELEAQLDFRGMEPSVLSKAINGKRELTPKQIDVFCDTIGLTDEERWRLKEALNRDYVIKHGLEFDHTVSPKDIEHFAVLSRRVYDVRIAGSPHMAITLAQDLMNWLKEKKDQAISLVSIQRLLKIQADVLFEQATAYKSITQSSDILDNIRPYYIAIQRIAKECNNDKELHGMANILLGDAHYIQGNYQESIRLLNLAVDDVDDPDYRLSLLRTLALDYAYLNEQGRFEHVEKKLRRVVERGVVVHTEYIRAVYEGIARGQGLLKLPKAFQTLAEGQSYAAEGAKEGTDALRQVQYLRSTVELLQRLEPTERNTIEKTIDEGAQLAKAFQLKKYTNIFTNLGIRYATLS